MKKIVKIVICLCLTLACSISFFACDLNTDDKFYEETNKKFNTFIEKVCENEKYSDGLIYGEYVTGILDGINKGNISGDKIFEYTQLTEIYDKIFINSFTYLSKFKNTFANIPNELTTGTKKAYKNFEKQLDTVQDKIEELDVCVQNLDADIGSSKEEIANKDISIQYVRNFKRTYIQTSKDLINLCTNFLDLCETYIYPKYETYHNGEKYITLTDTQLANQRTIAVLKSSINTLNPAIKYLEAFNGNYQHLDGEVFIATLNNYLTLSYEETESVTIEELQVWSDTYKAYIIEMDCFYSALDKLDFEELRKNYNYDLTEYAQTNVDKKPFVQKVQSFSSQKITTLYNTVKTICD